MQSKIFLAAIFLASVIMAASVSIAATQVLAVATTAGETTITTSASSSSGTLDTNFRNAGISAYSSYAMETSSGLVLTNSFAAIGSGSYSASNQPSSYRFVPRNVPNPTWRLFAAGSATYVQ